MKSLSIILIVLSFILKIHSQETSTFTDSRDGKTYKTVKIGNQVWMAENLNYDIEDSWCYDNDTNNCKLYGRLYTWNMASQVCPKGWRLPNESEFDTLLNNVGGSGETAYRNLISGGITNFCALLGGWCGSDGVSYNIDEFANFWSSSMYDETTAWHLYFYTSRSRAVMIFCDPSCGFSVRCLKNN